MQIKLRFRETDKHQHKTIKSATTQKKADKNHIFSSAT